MRLIIYGTSESVGNGGDMNKKYEEIFELLNGLTYEELNDFNKAYNDYCIRVRNDLTNMKKSELSVGDRVHFDYKGRKFGTITKLKRTKALVKDETIDSLQVWDVPIQMLVLDPLDDMPYGV